jgi:sugar (pentulose or hexulose) kinase
LDIGLQNLYSPVQIRVPPLRNLVGSLKYLNISSHSVANYRDTFAPNVVYIELMAMAGRWLPGARGVLFLPHLSGERSPHQQGLLRLMLIAIAIA